MRTTRNRDEKRGIPQGVSSLAAAVERVHAAVCTRMETSRVCAALWPQIVTYADDLVIFCKRGAVDALPALRQVMTRLKLTMNESKTHVRDVPRESFEFLGYTFGRCYSPKTGRAYIGTWPSKKSVQRMIEKITTCTARNTTWQDANEVVESLNWMLRGWANYFRLGPVSKAYRALDSHTTRRLRRWLCLKHKDRRRGRYRNEYLYQQLGLICLAPTTRNLPWAKA